MKKIAVTITFVFLSMIFTACGGNASYSDNATQTLQAGEVVEVSTGDTLTPDSEDTEIEVVHVVDNDTKYVKIISGSATLLKGNYVLTN